MSRLRPNLAVLLASGLLATVFALSGCGSMESADNGMTNTYDGAGHQDTSTGGDAWSGGDTSAGADTGSWTPDGGGQVPGPDAIDACAAACNGLQCGPNGCGGSCGWCPGIQSCQAGACVEVEGCVPQCTSKMVGEEDGCGGVCSGSGMGIGLKPGGAQDAGYFKLLVRDGQVPDPDLLPIEGWLNEHGTPLPPPDTSALIDLHAFLGLFYDPIQAEPIIAMQLGLNSGLDPAVIQEGRFNLSVVVDKSGSMGGDPIRYVRNGLKLMVDELDENDVLSIVVYDNTARILLPPTPVVDKDAIKRTIDTIAAGGATNIYEGMQLGYEQVVASMAQVPDAHHRIMLLSDGVATAGIMDTASIVAASAQYNSYGIGITTIGVGLQFDFDLMYQLANQGNGNFYFLDAAETLAAVFQEEIRFLLTPVARNLRISFQLTDGFGVSEVYGFDFAEVNGEVVLLGPAPQYHVGPEGPPPVTGENPDVAVSTVFASKKNGLLMVQIQGPDASQLQAFQNLTFANITYAYTLVEDGEVEVVREEPLLMGPLAMQDAGSFEYFTDNIVRRNFCILRMALSMKQACTLFHDSAGLSVEEREAAISEAMAELGHADTFCSGVHFALTNDGWVGEDVDVLTQDLDVLHTLQDNICAAAGCQAP